MSLSKKAKVLFAGALVAGASVANAAITVDSSTGAISGSIELTPFMTGAAVIITALGAFWAVRKVIGLFGR
ncbi:MAG: hypothetical protein MR902_08015 [Campylobacter sp.]|nr:hypothetical protein [Campylobacter sp.]